MRAYIQGTRHLGAALALGLLLSATGCETERVVVVPVVSGLRANIVGGEIRLFWTHTGGTEVRLLRRLNAEPVSADDPDATVIYQGGADGVIDDLTALLPSTQSTTRAYHYAAFPCGPGGACNGTPSRTTLLPSLAACLRAGGYTIWWRHATSTTCVDNTSLGTKATTSVPNWWKSCDANCGTATARQISDQGRNEATTIGQAFDQLGIPVGRVISSEFCRCVTTAQLMDFGPAIETDTTITYYVYDEANRCGNAFLRIVAPPAPGTNTALVGHAGFTGACDLGSLAMGEAAIYKPREGGTADAIERVHWDEWLSIEGPVPLGGRGPRPLAASGGLRR